MLAALLALALPASGCGGVSAARTGIAPGSLARSADLSGQTYVVGSESGDEQQILCQISIAALESAGAKVTDRCDRGDTAATRTALLNGDISTYWEYTGVAWSTYLGEGRRPDDATMLRTVRARDLAEHHVVWLDQAVYDTRYAFVVEGAAAARLRLDTVDEMAEMLDSGAPGNVCVDPDYRNRPDGLGDLRSEHDVEIPPERIQVVPQDVIFQSTADGVCLFGEVPTTDDRIASLGLHVLTDDDGHQLTYSPAPTFRQDVYERAPQVANIFAPITGALDAPTIRQLIARVAGGESPRDVARAWLSARGYVG